MMTFFSRLLVLFPLQCSQHSILAGRVGAMGSVLPQEFAAFRDSQQDPASDDGFSKPQTQMRQNQFPQTFPENGSSPKAFPVCAFHGGVKVWEVTQERLCLLWALLLGEGKPLLQFASLRRA